MALGELARAANLGTVVMSRIERGIECPPDSVLEPIAKLLDWTLEELKAAIPSKEDAERDYCKMSDGITAMLAAQSDAKIKGLKKGHGGQSTMACPICKGTLHYSVASVNGHLWGRCATDGCVSWMQ
jgi:hypothetical protein